MRKGEGKNFGLSNGFFVAFVRVGERMKESEVEIDVLHAIGSGKGKR